MDRICVICGRGEDQVRIGRRGGEYLCSKHLSQWYRHHRFDDNTIYSPNEYVLYEDRAEIVLKDKNSVEVGRAIIDLDDVEKCKPYKWHMRLHNYVIATIPNGTKSSNEKVHLHRLITGYDGAEYVVDHINRNPLDNRKANLRVVPQSVNAANNGASGVIKTPGGKYQAHVMRNYKSIYIGTCDTYSEAAALRNQFVKDYDNQYAERIS